MTKEKTLKALEYKKQTGRKPLTMGQERFRDMDKIF